MNKLMRTGGTPDFRTPLGTTLHQRQNQTAPALTLEAREHHVPRHFERAELSEDAGQ